MCASIAPEEHVTKSENNLTPPLALAASSGSLAIVGRLIRAGVDPFTGSFEGTAIADAAWRGRYEVVCRLHDEMERLEKSHNPARPGETSNIRSEGPKTSGVKGTDRLQRVFHNCLYNASIRGHASVFRYLITKSQPDTSQAQEYMQKAVSGGHIGVVEILVAEKFPVTSPEGENNPLVDIAIRNDNPHVLGYLIDQGVVSQWDEKEKETSIHFAAREGYTLCLRELLRVSSEDHIRLKNGAGDTALEHAVRHGSLGALEELVDWEAKNSKTQPPPRPAKALQLALKSNSKSLKVVRFLVENGWDVNKADGADQDFPLHIAAQELDDWELDILVFLLDRATTVNPKNKKEETPIFTACLHGKPRVVRLLLGRGGGRPDVYIN